jgi:uncharacterized protein with FMN-binding domain
LIRKQAKKKEGNMKMHLKKILVSLLVFAGFVSYAVYQHFNTGQPVISGNQNDNNSTANTASGKLADSSGNQPSETSATTAAVKSAENNGNITENGVDEDLQQGDDENGNTSATQTTQAGSSSSGTTASSSSSIITVPAPTATSALTGAFKDGEYVGVNVDAFYGNVQVRAIIQGGKIADIQFLSYPDNANHSRQVNSYAMPRLKEEAIASQSAQVNVVSGATYTSLAFIQSLGSALDAAKA